MPTDTKLNQLIINQLTQEQYDEAKAAGTLSDTELYITDSDDDALTNNNISNCITEIPQDIKLELNNGTLTLKAGSKVYIPNGTGNFDKVTITQDVSDGADSNRETLLFYKVGYGALATMPAEYCFSGATAPTNFYGGIFAIWYDTTNNVIKLTENGGTNWDSGYSLPICLAHETTTTYSISQVFNGFGYIGSTIYALPGVKGLIPNGRNEDGSLKNIEFTLDKVIIKTHTSGTFVCKLILTSNNIDGYIKLKYDELSNYNIDNGMQKVLCDAGTYITDNGRITSLTPKKVFHALDYNDKSTISGWGMPSSRYIDLTLGADDSIYRAPANGYFYLRKAAMAANQYIDMENTTLKYSFQTNAPAGRIYCTQIIPAQNGDLVRISYTVNGPTDRFRFIYAEGEN